jgi:hypothetical protein
MVRAIAQIEQEIAALDQTVVAIAQAFYDAYQQYLAALGQAVRQQLVLAAYHICTNSYPEQFTQQTLSQRQTLQQALRQLARQAQSELIESLCPVSPPDAKPKLLIAQSEPSADDISDDAASPTEALFDPVAEARFSEALSDLRSEFQPEPAERDGLAADDSAPERLHPRDIAHWQSDLEDEILEVLQTISHATNQVLQQAKILPDRLPEPILEVAAKADLSSETAVSPPNLMNLLIEADDDSEHPGITQVVAVRLRLSEVEFGDAGTAAQRSKLRHLLTQLSKLGREYQRRQKERAIAQAEAAWRSSWYEDAD